MKRGGGLHPARPDCWPPTQRPRATPGGLIAAGVTCLSRREGAPPCLRTSPPLGGTLEVHRTSWRIPFPRHACTFLVLGFRGAWVSHAPPQVPKQRRPQDAALPPVSRSRLAGSPAWHGLPQCPGCGHWVSYCCAAFVFGSGLRLGVGFVNPASPGWGLGWVCLGMVCGVVPLVPAVCGVRGWAAVSACLWDVCGFVRSACPPPFPVPVCGVGVHAGPGSRLCPALLGLVVGVCFLRFFFVVSVAWCPCPGPSGPCPPIPFLSGWAAGSFFFFVVCVCMFRCLFSRWAAVPGLVLPVFAGWSRCASLGVLSSVPSGGGIWPPLVVLAGGLVAVGCFRAPPLPPLLFFFGGGPACSSLCLPWAGARTGPHSVLSSGLLLPVAFCLAVFRPHGSGGLCTRWARRPFLPG